MDITTNAAYPTPFANSTLLPSLLMMLALQKHTPKTKETFQKEYDYIVVGAGSAGAVVASRLSEVPCVRVLLLEAGKPPPLISEVPGLFASFLKTDIDWAYKTVPQRHAARSMINNQVFWPRGKALGGSSTTNAMMYVRGNRRDYDGWAGQGAVGWSHSDVWPYFLKMEDNTDLEDGYEVRGGPMTVESNKYTSEIFQPTREALYDMGYDVVNSNGLMQTGAYNPQRNTRRNQRCSTAKGYLVPAENRCNLDIVTEAFVTKIIINGNRALAVHVDHKNQTHRVEASREIIVSAGTVNTPQLLMLSGIGPKEHLEEMGIRVVKDLPVGDNLHDRIGIPLIYTLKSSIPTVLQKVSDPKRMEEYIQNKTGVLGSVVQWMVFLKSDNSTSGIGEDFPRSKIAINEGVTSILKTYNLKEEVYEEVYAPFASLPALQCVAQIQQPESRGTIRLKSSDPYEHPLIDPNYLGDARDISYLVDALKVCQKLGTHPSLVKLGSKRTSIPHPECKEFAIDSDEYFRCLTRSFTVSAGHMVGTAKMGRPSDPTTVVDSQLRVKGIRRLRVVDASVMPTIPSANTNVPTIMVAEKAADIIKSTINC